MADADLNVYAHWPDGTPADAQLVWITTAPSEDWFELGMPIFPSPRRTGPDGGVNYYHGGPLPKPMSVQFTCQNGTTDPVIFDGTQDVTVQLEVIPFD